MAVAQKKAVRRTAAKAGKSGRTGGRPAAARNALDFQSDSLGYALRRAQLRAYEVFYATLSAVDLTPARLTALSIIATEPEINQAMLAARLRVSGPSVVKLLDALQSRGLVERGASGDRRSYVLALTAEGRAKLEELRTRMPQYEARIAARLTAAERKQLMVLLEKVAPQANAPAAPDET
jgi:DNA-binding MarR family transcriptional regulator